MTNNPSIEGETWLGYYKCSWEVEPGTTMIKSNEWSERVLNPESLDLKASILTTEPHYLLLLVLKTGISRE